MVDVDIRCAVLKENQALGSFILLCIENHTWYMFELGLKEGDKREFLNSEKAVW